MESKFNKNSELRDMILATSVEIIAENGIRGLSFREVARRANVSHQAPYHYFKNDSEILTAIARDGFIKLSLDMKGESAKHPNNPLNALTASGIAYVLFALSNPGHFRVMFERSLLPAGTSIADLPEAKETHQVLKDLANTVIQSGIANKIGLEGLTLLCWSTVHGIASLLSEGLGGSVKTKSGQKKIATQVVSGLQFFLNLDTR